MKFIKRFWFWFWPHLLFIVLIVITAFGVAQYEKKKAEPHKPEFTSGQCFAKQGLREPWDLDVAGKVVLKGYTKYLVMFTSEAERTTLTKWGTEQEIEAFDNKYQAVPCPESWVKHTSTKGKQ